MTTSTLSPAGVLAPFSSLANNFLTKEAVQNIFLFCPLLQVLLSFGVSCSTNYEVAAAGRLHSAGSFLTAASDLGAGEASTMDSTGNQKSDWPTMKAGFVQLPSKKTCFCPLCLFPNF